MYRSLVRIRNELAYLEMHLTDHPLRVLRDEATRAGCVAPSELAARRGRFAPIAGVGAAPRRLVTRGGQVMQFVTFEDEHGLVETVLFPGAYATLGDPVTDPGPFLVGGRVEEDHGDVQLRVSEVLPFHRRPRPYGKAEPAGAAPPARAQALKATSGIPPAPRSPPPSSRARSAHCSAARRL